MQINRFTFFLLDKFDLHSFSAAVEALRLANEVIGQAVYEWCTVTADGQPAMSSCGIRIAADIALADEKYQLHRSAFSPVVVVCGGASIPPADGSLSAWLRLCRRNRVPLAGLAGGLYSLAQAGLLAGRRCAAHWRHFPHFSESFFMAEARRTTYEIDDRLYTCGGGNVPFDMILHIVEAEFGKDVSNRVCEIALADRLRAAGERQRLPLQARLGIHNEALIRIIEQMEINLSEPLGLAEISMAGGLSRRQMERLFQQEMGRSPASYYRDVRLEHGHLLLLNSSLPVIEVATACGFISASHFSRTYRDRYGCTPQQTRLAEIERQRPGRSSTQVRDHAEPQMKRVA